MAQRIVRAKRKLHDNHVSYEYPARRSSRTGSLRSSPHLSHLHRRPYRHVGTEPDQNRSIEGSCPAGANPRRADARRTRGHRSSRPDAAQRVPPASRRNPDGTMVRLADQDRSRWNKALIIEGHQLVRACLRSHQPGPFQVQAA